MADLTTGALVVSVLTQVAEAGLDEVAKSVIKDAYDGFKSKLLGIAGNKIVVLEQAPDSAKLKAEVARDIDIRSEDERAALRILAQELIAKINQNSKAVGLNMTDLDNVDIALKDLNVRGSGTAALLERVRGGKIEVDGIHVGEESPK